MEYNADFQSGSLQGVALGDGAVDHSGSCFLVWMHATSWKQRVYGAEDGEGRVMGCEIRGRLDINDIFRYKVI